MILLKQKKRNGSLQEEDRSRGCTCLELVPFRGCSLSPAVVSRYFSHFSVDSPELLSVFNATGHFGRGRFGGRTEC